MELEKHIFFSIIFSLILILIGFPFQYSLIFFLSSVFIDLDHLLDYFIYHPMEIFKPVYFLKQKLNYFFSLKWYPSEKDFILLILHSIEIIFLLGFINLFLNSNILFFIFLGFSFHMFLDLIWNCFIMKDTPFLLYFISYRAIKRFNYSELFKGVKK